MCSTLIILTLISTLIFRSWIRAKENSLKPAPSEIPADEIERTPTPAGSRKKKSSAKVKGKATEVCISKQPFEFLIQVGNNI